MQCCTRNYDTANIDGLQQRPRVDGTCAPDIHANVEQFHGNLYWEILESNCAAWITSHRSQFLLLRQVINLNHHTIDLVGQVETLLFPFFAIVHDLAQGRCLLDVWIDGKTPFANQLQRLPLVAEIHALHIANLVAEEIEVAAGSDAGIFLSQRACRGIAWIGKQPIIFHFFIELLEAFGRHVNFAANFHPAGNLAPAQLLRDGANRADIGSPVLTYHSVAACSPNAEPAIIVG